MDLFMTGATGFVGRHLLPLLVDEGHTVRCLVRRRSAKALPQNPAITPVPGNIHESAQLVSALDGCQAVIHLVGIIAEAGRNTFYAVHTVGTRNLVEAMRRAGVRRLVHMSALGARPGARSRYHRTKYDAEVIVRSSRLDYTIFRPSIIHGPDGEFTRLLKRLASFPVFPVPGPGTALLQPVSVGDVARTFASSLSMPETVGRAISLGGPRQYTLPEMVNIVATALGHSPRRAFHIPLPVMSVLATAMELVFPLVGRAPAVNMDQLLMLEEDSVCDIRDAEEIFGRPLADLPGTLRAYL